MRPAPVPAPVRTINVQRRDFACTLKRRAGQVGDFVVLEVSMGRAKPRERRRKDAVVSRRQGAAV